MARSLMLLLLLAAFSCPATAEEPKVCGAPTVAQWPDANIHAVVVVRNGKLAMERYLWPGGQA